MKKIGLITYHYPHLKTEQVFEALVRNYEYDYCFYALPFVPRPERPVVINHRPNQIEAVATEELALKNNCQYIQCASDEDIDDSCDIYLILGAGILSPNCIINKTIINCHPGILPTVRGLDSFKWAIYNKQPLGVTLHYIDEGVDQGDIIYVLKTNVYRSDSLATLARRHYENEIYMTSNFKSFLDGKKTPEMFDYEVGDATRRMPIGVEGDMCKKFDSYIELYGN